MSVNRLVQNQERSEPPHVILSTEAIETITDVTSNCPVETGGTLLGQRTKGKTFLVVTATGPGPNAKHEEHSFSPDVGHQQERIKTYFRRNRCNYLGEYHKHPGDYSILSPQDRAQVRRIILDPSYVISEVLVGIVTLVEGSPKLHLYECRLENDDLIVTPVDFDVVPLKVTPDTDAGTSSEELGHPVDANRSAARRGSTAISLDRIEPRGFLSTFSKSMAFKDTGRFLDLGPNPVTVNSSIHDARNTSEPAPTGWQRLGTRSRPGPGDAKPSPL